MSSQWVERASRILSTCRSVVALQRDSAEQTSGFGKKAATAGTGGTIGFVQLRRSAQGAPCIFDDKDFLRFSWCAQAQGGRSNARTVPTRVRFCQELCK
jgi:hypothetical protein